MTLPDCGNDECPTVPTRTLRDREMLDLMADCRNGHAELLADEPRWLALPVVGLYVSEHDDNEIIETRVCACGDAVSKERTER